MKIYQKFFFVLLLIATLQIGFFIQHIEIFFLRSCIYYLCIWQKKILFTKQQLQNIRGHSDKPAVGHVATRPPGCLACPCPSCCSPLRSIRPVFWLGPPWSGSRLCSTDTGPRGSQAGSAGSFCKLYKLSLSNSASSHTSIALNLLSLVEKLKEAGGESTAWKCKAL